jgi:hypothetical protein
MAISRRSFLGGALAVAALPSSALAASSNPPRIVGDGFHDDADGIQALIDGNPFERAERSGVYAYPDGVYAMHNGAFRITKTLQVRRGQTLHMHNCLVICEAPGGVDVQVHPGGEFASRFPNDVYVYPPGRTSRDHP